MAEDRRWSRIDELLDAALDLPSHERSSWLDTACGGDAELRGAVAHLLALSDREDDGLRPMGALAGPVWEEVARDLDTEPESRELPAGHTLGDYVLLGVLGRGGTGTVYRARDPRLDREVAVKALSHGFPEGSPELRRLEREARLLASLNHPNIAVVYELLFVEHTPYLVLELVPGESLADRVARSALPVAEALRAAQQVAEALEEAYRNGVVHRDLKPANVMLTPAGRVKVLDFGLAKAAPPGASPATSSTPLRSPPTTREGMVLGTPAYMSPEQARGEVVDHRTDVWALGCIVYEMVTGHRAFRGETVTETLASVLRDDVDWTRLPAVAPSALVRFLRRCLQKDPRLRFQDVGDARIELGELLGETAGRPPWLMALRRWWRPAALAAAALALAAGAFFLGRVPGLRARATSSAPVRVSVAMGPNIRLWIGASPSLAISPDGSRIAFVGESGGRTQLYERELGSYTATPVRSSEDARSPFYSPDGRWIGFFAQGELRKVPTAGATPEKIAAGGLQSRGASWAEDGRIVFAQAAAPGLQVVDAAGGEVHLLTSVDRARGEVAHLWPQWLPGGKRVLFTVQQAGGSSAAEELFVVTPETGERRRLREGSQAVYAASGHLVFVSRGRLEAAPFDPRRLESSGPGVSLLDSLEIYPRASAAFAVSASGTLLYVPSHDGAVLGWVDRDGKAVPIDTPPGTPGWPRISPNGRRVAIHLGRAESREVWVFEVDRPRALRQLTFEGGGFPVWSPDSRRVAFSSQREGGGTLAVVAADGSEEPHRLLDGTRIRIPVSWARGLLAYYEIGEGNQRDIWVVNAAGGEAPVAFAVTAANEFSPVFSPDGRWLAYVSNETGRNEVYVRPYPPPGPVTAVSIDGGTEPVWRRDGAELFYRHGEALMAVAVRRTSGFSVGPARRVLVTEMVPNAAGNPGFDVTPDGQRFLFLRPTDEASVEALNVVLGWAAELERLASAP
jgi:Tol biopolymer transport system component